jgi:hypothetical protein
VDLYHRRGAFKGWHTGQTQQFAVELFKILGHHTGRGLEFSVLRQIFNKKKRELGMVREGSPYEFCFKGMISQLLQDPPMQTLLAMPGVDISVIVEHRLANKGGIQRAFSNLQIVQSKLRSLEFADKKALIALQVADFLAFYTRRVRVAQLLGKPFEDDLAFFEEVVAPVTYAPFLATDFHTE